MLPDERLNCFLVGPTLLLVHANISRPSPPMEDGIDGREVLLESIVHNAPFLHV